MPNCVPESHPPQWGNQDATKSCVLIPPLQGKLAVESAGGTITPPGNIPFGNSSKIKGGIYCFTHFWGVGELFSSANYVPPGTFQLSGLLPTSVLGKSEDVANAQITLSSSTEVPVHVPCRLHAISVKDDPTSPPRVFSVSMPWATKGLCRTPKENKNQDILAALRRLV